MWAINPLDDLKTERGLIIGFSIALVAHLLLTKLPMTKSSQWKVDEAILKRDAPIEVFDFSSDSTKTVVQTSKAAEQEESDNKPAPFAGEFRNRVKEQTQAIERGRFREGVQKKSGVGLPSGENGDFDGMPSLSDLMPRATSPNFLAQGLTPGNQTVLNTDSVVYASFINRIADEIYDPWVVRAREAIHLIYNEGRKLEANVYITKLAILMKPTGEVASIQVLQSCGVSEIDEAPKKAFWETEPYPNPPTQLFQKNSEFVKFVYEFHFEWKSSSFNIVPWQI